ncbi:hypothetical protein CL622_07315 [archaeon]|nr:hypothetical protein [archaeon]
MTQGPRLTLMQLQQQTPKTAEDFHKSSYHVEVNLLGFDIKYACTPFSKLEQYFNGQRFGAYEGDRLFVSRQHPTVQAFQAGALFFASKSPEELREMLGVEALRDYDDGQVREVADGMLFEHAGEVLKPRHLADLINLFKYKDDESDNTLYIPNLHDPIFAELIENYGQRLDGQTVQALMLRNGASLDFYTEHMDSYLKAHHNNKWNKRSRMIRDFVQDDERLQYSWAPEMVKADTVYDDIVNDDLLSQNMAQVLSWARRMQDPSLKVGHALNVGDPVGARLLYLCSTAIHNPPFEFVNVHAERPNVNMVRITNGNRTTFFQSLEKRLEFDVLRELELTQQAISGISEVVTEVRGGQEAMLKLRDYCIAALNVPLSSDQIAQTNQLISSPDRLIPVLENNLRKRENALKLLATNADSDVFELSRLHEAYQTLLDYGSDVRPISKQIRITEHGRIAPLENITLPAPSPTQLQLTD